MRVSPLKGRDVAVDARYLTRKGVGISRVLSETVAELIEAGANVTLLLHDPHWCAELSADYPDATIIPVPENGNSRFLWEQIALRKHLRNAEYDAFIAPANYGLPFRYRGRTKLMLIVHDLVPLRLPRLHLLNRPVWAAFYLVSTAIAVAKADRIVTVSYSSARDIAHLLHRKQVSVVYPQLNYPQFNQASHDEERSSESLRSEFGDYFVYNGGADPRKNVPMLLRAVALIAAHMPTVQLVMLGTGYDSYREMIENLGVNDRVHLLGYVSESQKSEIIRGAVGLVYPSSYEGFGIPLIEGMAAGIPIVTGTGGSLAEVGGNAAIYVRPLTDKQLASAMLEATRETTRVRARTTGREQLAELTRRQGQTRLADVVAAILR
jgi:glycosyltransferase involved in cell wall biosynthesis